MYTNGLVIQRYSDRTYKGIDGSGSAENWFFNDDVRLSSSFEPYYDEHIGKIYYDYPPKSRVDVCTDWKYINSYIEESRKLGIAFRLLLCEIEAPEPQMLFPNIENKLLGYDYAYSGGDYYSAVYNEIPFIFPQFRLNENGLFETEEEIMQFISERERFEMPNPPYTLELGDFIVYRLFELFV